MYDAVRRLAEKKPVVAVCGTLATSAAYIVALATDRIFVYGNTITGSVGVIFQWADVTELLHTLGVKVEEVKSGPFKAVPSPFEPIDEKARALTEEMVQDSKAWFVGLVAERRNIDPECRSGPHRRPHLFGPPGRRAEARRPDRRREGGDGWLNKQRNVASPGLKIVDWKPKQESSGLFGWLFQSMAGSIGLSAEQIADIAGANLGHPQA